MIDKLTAESFTPYLGQSFRLIYTPDVILPLELIDVTAREHPRRRLPWEKDDQPQRVPFSIVFRGPIDQPLAQHMYHVEHDTLGVIADLFLVPIGIDPHGRYYEAVFN